MIEREEEVLEAVPDKVREAVPEEVVEAARGKAKAAKEVSDVTRKWFAWVMTSFSLLSVVLIAVSYLTPMGDVWRKPPTTSGWRFSASSSSAP